MKDETKKIVGIIGLILAIIGCFLPFASVSFIGTINVNYLHGDGKIILILLIIGALFFALNVRGITATGCVISLMIVGYDTYQLYNLISENEYGSLASLGIGPILIIIGCVATIFGCITEKEKKVELKETVENIKFCPSCGTELNCDSKYCDKCGAKQPNN